MEEIATESGDANQTSGGQFDSIASSRVQSPAAFKVGGDYDDDNVSVASFGSRGSSFVLSRQKLLTIERKVKDGAGGEKVQVEMIRDPRIINAYLRQKQLQEARKLQTEGGDSLASIISDPSKMPNPFKQAEDEDSKKRKASNVSFSNMRF